MSDLPNTFASSSTIPHRKQSDHPRTSAATPIANTANPNPAVTTASASAPAAAPHHPATAFSSILSLDRDLLSSSLGAAAAAATSSTALPSSALHMARLQTHFANLAPACTTHLADHNGIPIMSTCTNTAARVASSLSTLSTAFVQAHDTASRMGLGKPLRVTLSTGPGVAVIQSAILPLEDEEEEEEDDGEDDDDNTAAGGASRRHRRILDNVSGENSNAMLVGTVVAPEDKLAEARIASWGVEDVARKLQKYIHEVK